MKNLRKAIAVCLSMLLLMVFPVGVSAADLDIGPITLAAPDYLIDEDRIGSLTIYKYDLTNSEKDGVWDSSYVSTGVYDQTVNDTLGGDANALGNGGTGYGYAIPGVEFSYVKVADIIQFSESENDQSTEDHVEVLYGIDKTAGADFLKAIGLTDGAKRYENADHLDETKYYYQSDVLVEALATSLEANSTTVKNAMESYMASNNGVAMPLTDEYGKTVATNLPLGLYLVVETKVPEMVVSTTDPFLVSLPMTSVDGTNATDGGTRWIYDVTLYPKNLTGIPSLEKTLREAFDRKKSRDGISAIGDDYAHTGTASAGDLIDYQIISTLPSITSASTYLSCYTFVDTLSPGLSYVKGDVVLSFYKDASCVDYIVTWEESDGKFTVTYNTTEQGESIMRIEMTEAGLSELNTAKTVYTDDSMVNAGYSDCTMRITYQAKMNSDDSVVYGDKGNPNSVVLTWQRSSDNFYDVLVDDAHVYTYGLDLTKRFSDGRGDFSKVEFLIRNENDGYYVKAELDEESGIYYVTGQENSKADGTRFVPVTSGNANGKIIIKGLEDDFYTLHEVRTASGYTLLKKGIDVEIYQTETTELCDIYSEDVLGLIQNDPKYAEIIKDTGDLHNMPQKHLEHKLLTASAAIDGNKVNMKEDNASVNALAPLTVVNTRGFNLPETGDNGTVLTTVIGIVAMAGAAAVIVAASRKKKSV